MKTTGPFVLTPGVPLQLDTPIDFPIAVVISNQSPYLLEMQVANKTSFLSPNIETLVTLSHTTQSFTVTPQQLSGTVPSGMNSDIYATWYDQQDEAAVQAAALNRPVGLAPNSVISGSTVESNVSITAPVNANGSVETAVLSPVDSAGHVAVSVDANPQMTSSGSVALSTTAETLAASASALWNLVLSVAGSTGGTVDVLIGATTELSVWVPATSTVVVPLDGVPVPSGDTVTATSTVAATATLHYT